MLGCCARVTALQCVEAERVCCWLLAVDCKDGFEKPPSYVHLSRLPGAMRLSEVLLDASGHARELRLAGRAGQAADRRPSSPRA